MAELGMDPRAVLAIARTLEHQQRAIIHVGSSVGSSVDRAVAEARSRWKGSDVGQFAGRWALHKAELRNASTALDELATKAKTNAAIQGDVLGSTLGGSLTTHDVGFDVGTGLSYARHGLSYAGHAIDSVAPWNW